MTDDFTRVKSAVRALQVIDLLAQEPHGLSFAQLQERTGWPRSSTYNLLRTMEETGHIAFDEGSRTYSVGLRVWEAGQSYERAHDLSSHGQAYLQSAAAALGETVQLAVLDGLDNVYIAKVDTNHQLRLVSEIGSRLPAYTTGLGKVLLAHLSETELRQRLKDVELHAFTPNTIADKEELIRHLKQIREAGYATDIGEHTLGVFCVAVPVRDSTGAVVAAMSSSVPEARVDDALKKAMHEVLSRSASDLSRALGFRG